MAFTSNEMSKQENYRYDLIMKDVRGIQSLNLDPMSALGIEARNNAELCVK